MKRWQPFLMTISQSHCMLLSVTLYLWAANVFDLC